ncbi:unnamed protein product [Owenia fusiformis]|uniref:Uncharacterized protein n=1 Tax=Owenia fusiformis TaxID=6347 RepID=A0A8J1Y6Z7_OWEFU|nr:unnamed protein product [Owenia fusiformis]
MMLKYRMMLLLMAICMMILVMKNVFLTNDIPTKVSNKTSKIKKKNEFEVMNNVEKHRHIIIFTNRRSGSSFIGKLFSEHPDVFYMFEPLKPLEFMSEKNIMEDIGYNYTNDIIKCKFSSLYNHSIHHPKQPWKMSKIFPGYNNMNDILNTCKEKPIVVGKIIRIHDLEKLIKAVANDVQILLLLRDPRGILNSRIHEKEKYKNMALHKKKLDMKKVCAMDLKNLKFFLRINDAQEKSLSDESRQKIADDKRNLPLHGLKRSTVRVQQHNIRLILYDKFVLDPIKQTSEIYQSLGLQMHENVSQWLMKNSNQKSNLTYGTSRKSEDMARKWKTELSTSDLKMVENIEECLELIQVLTRH